MKHWSLVLLMAVAFAPGFVSAQDTAYKAVRAVGTQRGEKALNQITAVVGQSGRPQPVAWRISLDDPAARGGVPGDAERFDQRALQRAHPRWQQVRHAALNDRVLGEAAAGSVIAMKGDQRTMIVLTRTAVQAVPAGFQRFHRDQLPRR